MRFFVGTSGYSYKEWKGSFYPEKMPANEMLSFYARRFSTVEINNTFYRMPAPSVLESWAPQVPENFRFVLKAAQAITHFKRLKDIQDSTERFLQVASVLKQRLGPLLFQLPPNFKKDLPRLETDSWVSHSGRHCRCDEVSPRELVRRRGRRKASARMVFSLRGRLGGFAVAETW